MFEWFNFIVRSFCLLFLGVIIGFLEVNPVAMEESDEYGDTTNLLRETVCNDYGATLGTGNDQIIHLLEEREKKSKKRQKKKKEGLTLLFKFATWSDVWLIFFGTIFAVLSGILPPLRALFFGGMTNMFISEARYGLIPDESLNMTGTPLALKFDSTIGNVFNYKGNIFYQELFIIEEWFEIDDPFAEFGNDTFIRHLTTSHFQLIMQKYVIFYLVTGTLMILFCFLQAYFWELAGARIVYNVRRKYLSQVLRQDMSWYDLNEHARSLSDKLADDAEKVRNGIGYKCGLIVQSTSTFVVGVVIGLLVSPYLTLAILFMTPVIIGLNACTFQFFKSSAVREQKKYASAGSVAEEVLTNIKTVNAFGGQRVGVGQYYYWLEKGTQELIAKNTMFAVLIGLVFFIVYFVYALGFAVGSYLIQIRISSPGSVFTVFLSVVAGTLTITQSLPFWYTFFEAIGIVSFINDLIERKVIVDPYAKTGRKISRLAGRIEFKNTSFLYPTRPEVKVLDGFNLVVKPGQRIAIVGPKGVGKSTILGLILRFYDPTTGEIHIDDIAVPDFNIRWLRRQIVLVSREPVLFGVSIAENIMYGADDVTHEEVIEAAKQANAHDFINDLPRGYDTIVGDWDLQLSRGQKQRIAIARALVRNPKILLLDEATSGLDAASENIVQNTFEKVMEGRTTIIVTQRLSAVKNADKIYVLENGKLVESTQEELIAQKLLHYDETVDDVASPDVTSSVEKKVSFTLGQDGRRSPETSGSNGLSDPSDQNVRQWLPKIMEKNMTMFELIKLRVPEWPWLILGAIGFIGSGLVPPLLALCFGAMFHVFTFTGSALAEKSNFWTCVFVAFSLFCGVSYCLQFFSVSRANEKIISRLRELVFENILRQPVGWFDMDASSSPAILTNRLARNPPFIKAAIGDRAGQILSSTVTVIATSIISITYGWKLALCLAIIVLVIVELTLHQRRARSRKSIRDDECMENAERVESEAVKNIRTVQALGQEQLFIGLFTKYLDASYRKEKTLALKHGILYGLTSGLAFYTYAVAFGLGCYLVLVGEMRSEDVYKVFFSYTLCASVMGISFLFMHQDYSKARQSIRLLNFLLKRKSEIDSSSAHGVKPNITGTIEFRDVLFSYPTQPTVNVLRGLNLTVEAGKTLALVGESGCGKSTIVSLLERFYDPDEGIILVDGHDIRAWNLGHLRSNIGLVTKEPILFDTSIKDNIEYGAVALRKVVPFDVTMRAAKIANIHNFIMNLPERYNTIIGKRGVQLSSDQKQKVAIARALVRDPKILLLDEATSALDAESEKVVQAALDEAKVGRTCITVTHRLSTAQNADIICVVHSGKIVEQGTHEELEALKGHYFQLIQRRTLN